MTAIETRTGLYVYGVVPDDGDPLVFAGAEGVAPGAVRLVQGSGLAAVVGRVPLDEFGDEPLRRNLEDRDWLESKAAAHDRVLAAGLGTTPLVPLRFGTVYLDPDHVREMLDHRGAELRASLDRLGRRVELGVKAFFLEDEVAPPVPPASGRDYLVRKQRALEEMAHAEAAAVVALRRLHDRLSSLADESRINPPQRSELSGRRERMLLNGAYLVSAERETDFATLVDGVRVDRLDVTLTGPWPPYNFAEREDER